MGSGRNWISSLLFHDAVRQFAAECEATGMKITASKSEALVFDRRNGQVRVEPLPQV